MSEIRDFVQISKYAGERYDLIQAAGGNSSVKLNDNNLIIKASGYCLSEVNYKKGFSLVSNNEVKNILNNPKFDFILNKNEREKLTKKLIYSTIQKKHERPSIETLLHSLLLKYTLHTHPIVVNIISVKKKWKQILKEIFKKYKIALINYKTPGIELALELKEELNNFINIPKIIFLQNHGLIITSDFKDELYNLNEEVISKLESYLKINFSEFKLTNRITLLFNSNNLDDKITYLSQDGFINDVLIKNKNLFYGLPNCPDELVYCGPSAVKLNDINDIESIKKFINLYKQNPIIIIHKNLLFIRGYDLKKCKEIEDVLKSHIYILLYNKKKDINYLSNKEIDYLSNWEAEKYRKKL